MSIRPTSEHADAMCIPRRTRGAAGRSARSHGARPAVRRGAEPARRGRAEALWRPRPAAEAPRTSRRTGKRRRQSDSPAMAAWSRCWSRPRAAGPCWLPTPSAGPASWPPALPGRCGSSPARPPEPAHRRPAQRLRRVGRSPCRRGASAVLGAVRGRTRHPAAAALPPPTSPHTSGRRYRDPELERAVVEQNDPSIDPLGAKRANSSPSAGRAVRV